MAAPLRPCREGQPSAGGDRRRDAQRVVLLAASSCSTTAAGTAPGLCVPSSNTRPGVPVIRYLRPSATLRCSTDASHGPALAGIGVPSIIQSRQTLVASFAHQTLRDLSDESPPRIGYRKV